MRHTNAGKSEGPAVMSRRQLIQTGGVLVVGLGAGGCRGGKASPAGSRGDADQDSGDLYLTESEFAALEALTDVFIPEDGEPGAVVAQCARAINLLLSAFEFDPPMIFAGGPFSDRGGSAHNHFKDFIPLDGYEELAWRLKIEGSKGLPEREFNGPVTGWQQIYRSGLAALDEAAASYGFARFADMPLATREALIRSGGNEDIEALVDVAFIHTLDAMYGAPEYGGNQDLVGWGFTTYMGDVQPRGFTREEVENPDNPGLLDLLPVKRFQVRQKGLPQAALLPVPDLSEMQSIQRVIRDLMVLHSEEIAAGLVMNTQWSWARLQSLVSTLTPEEGTGQ